MTITERWTDFHIDNPHIYAELERLALDAYNVGQRRIGIAMIYETMRYNLRLRTLAHDGFKLNNDFRALYARELIARNPQLEGVIQLRERRAA